MNQGERIERLRDCLMPLRMTILRSAMAGRPMADSVVVARYNDGGDQDCQITAGQVRDAMDGIL